MLKPLGLLHMAEEFSGIDVAASVTILTTLPVAF